MAPPSASWTWRPARPALSSWAGCAADRRTGQSLTGRWGGEEVGSAATGRAASRRRSCSRCAARVEAAATAAAQIRVMPTPAAVFQGERETPGTGSEGPSPSHTVIAVWSADSPPRRVLVLSTRTAELVQRCHGSTGYRSGMSGDEAARETAAPPELPDHQGSAYSARIEAAFLGALAGERAAQAPAAAGGPSPGAASRAPAGGVVAGRPSPPG